MPDPTLGTLTPTDPAKVLARAAEKLGVPVPPTDEAKVERVAMALHRAHYERGRGIAPRYDLLDRFEKSGWLFMARAAIAAMDP